jgi:hypothetical protein
VSVLVYGISRDESSEPVGPTAGSTSADARSRQITCAGLVADVESLDGLLTTDAQTLVLYEEVVEAIAERGAVLPMRFGSVLDDDDAVRELLDGHAAEFTAALDRVQGAVEFGIRTALDERMSGTDGATAGTAYMQQRFQARQKAIEVKGQFEAALGPYARESVYRLVPDEQTAVAAAFLVDRDAVDTFLEQVAAVEASADGAVGCSGPWPPYSFVGDLSR